MDWQSQNSKRSTNAIPGEMTLNIPSFLTVSHDQATSKATLSIQDREVPHQRAMWGMCCFDGVSIGQNVESNNLQL